MGDHLSDFKAPFTKFPTQKPEKTFNYLWPQSVMLIPEVLKPPKGTSIGQMLKVLIHKLPASRLAHTRWALVRSLVKTPPKNQQQNSIKCHFWCEI